MNKDIALIIATLFFFAPVSASEDIAEVNQVFGEGDTVIYSHGPQACDTNCRLGREIAEETSLEGNLTYRPPTPEVGKTDKNLVLIGNRTFNYVEGSQEYNTDNLNLESLRNNEGRLSFRKTSPNQNVMVIRGDNQKSLYSGGQFFIDLMNGQNMGEVSGENSYTVEGSRYGKSYTLGDVSEIIYNPLVVYGADTQSMRQTAQELALAIEGEAINGRNLDDSDKKNRDLVLMNPPPVNQITEELAQEGKAWRSEEWSGTDGFRLNLVKNAFSFNNHALIVSGDVGSRTDLAAKYMAEFYDGEHQDIADKTSITRSKLPRTIEVDTGNSATSKVGESIPLTVSVKETGEEVTDYELNITRNGEDVTETDTINLDRDGRVSELTAEKYGSYTVLATKEDTSEKVYSTDRTSINVERPVRTEDLEIDMDYSTVALGEKVEIHPMLNGESVKAELNLDGESVGTDNLFEVQPESLGDHQIKVQKSEKRTDTRIVKYAAVEAVLTVEERSLLGEIQHFLTNLF